MTTDPRYFVNCGAKVVAAIFANLADEHPVGAESSWTTSTTADELLAGQPHEVFAAVLIATALARRLNKLEPGHADELLTEYGYRFTEEPPHG